MSQLFFGSVSPLEATKEAASSGPTFFDRILMTEKTLDNSYHVFDLQFSGKLTNP